MIAAHRNFTTRDSRRWETRGGSVDNITIRESNNHNYNWETLLNYNSET
jgi:hypothetical protein